MRQGCSQGPVFTVGWVVICRSLSDLQMEKKPLGEIYVMPSTYCNINYNHDNTIISSFVFISLVWGTSLRLRLQEEKQTFLFKWPDFKGHADGRITPTATEYLICCTSEHETRSRTFTITDPEFFKGSCDVFAVRMHLCNHFARAQKPVSVAPQWPSKLH